MKITKIIKHKRGSYELFVDEQFAFMVDLDTLTRFSLSESMPVTPELLILIQTATLQHYAMEKAYLFLSYRDYSEKELYEKLYKKSSPNIAEQTIEKLKQQGLLNDKRYAEKLAAHFLTQKYFSYRKSLFEMTRKGLSKEDAIQALAQQDMDPQQQIAHLLSRKYKRYLYDQTFNGKKKIFNALARLGFQYDDIRNAIDQYQENMESNE